MKKIMIASALIAGLFSSAGAFATDDICAVGVATAPTAHVAGTNYMVIDIKPKCSANVYVKGIDGTGGAWYAVGSVSVKGKSSFKGNTNGGSVAINTTCAIPGGCTDTEADNAKTQANTDAGATPAT